MKIKLILIILLASILACQPSIKTIISKIEKGEIIECEFVGLSLSESEQFKQYKKLKKYATVDELSDLLNHNSPTVAAYASYALIEKSIYSPSEIFERYLNDNRKVDNMCGCLMSSSRLSELTYLNLYSSLIEYPDPQNFREFVLKDSKELFLMDSMIIQSKFENQELLKIVFSNRKYPEHFIQKIKELAFQNEQYYAVKYILENNLDDEIKISKTLDKIMKNQSTPIYIKEEIEQVLN